MNISKKSAHEIRELIEALAKKDFEKLTKNQWLGRLKQSDIEKRIVEYGVKLVSPPESFLDKADTYEYTDGTGGTIDIPLWSEEEGMSDLTLSLELLYTHPNVTLQMTDLRTL